MKKLLLFLVVFLLALPALAQDNAETQVVVKARDAEEGHEFTVTLAPGVYINHSNWYIFVVSNDTEACFKRLVGITSLYDAGTRTSYKGIESMGIFEATSTCKFTFTLQNADNNAVRGSDKVALLKVKKEKSIQLTWDWQKVTFAKGRFRYLDGINGYQVNPDKPGYEACMGDSSRKDQSGGGIIVLPKYVKITSRVDCYIRSLSNSDTRTIGFAKW